MRVLLLRPHEHRIDGLSVLAQRLRIALAAHLPRAEVRILDSMPPALDAHDAVISIGLPGDAIRAFTRVEELVAASRIARVGLVWERAGHEAVLDTELCSALGRSSSLVVFVMNDEAATQAKECIPKARPIRLSPPVPIGEFPDLTERRIQGAVKLRAMYLGRLIPSKRVDKLVAKWAQSKTVRNLSTLHVVSPADSPLYDELRLSMSSRECSEIRLSDYSTRPIRVDWYRQADVYISASELEGEPQAVLEAMACGLPVILSDIPGHAAFDLSAGAIKANPLSDAEIVDALRVLSDPQVRRDFGKRARRFVSRHRSPSLIAKACWDGLNAG